ncbi:MAG: outer membrane lipid asymmetry maintenance protein MlaD [Alphaproteobacteria bacterium]|nr:outer membrane lipid asymmetry maintenance protein MlaD [Alphaproteobacteria bacterium]
MGRNLVETVMGAVVLLIAGFFLIFAYNTSDLRPVSGYQLKARFNSVEGLQPGSDVRIGGVKVGSITQQRLDPETFQAVVTMTVRKSVRLPTDSIASVTGDSLLGGKYLKLTPGASKTFLAAGGEIKKTQDALVLEQILGRMIFLLTDSNETGK